MRSGVSEPARVEDATGLLCPLPLLRASRALRHLASGELLLLLSDDPAIEADLPPWCHSTGHSLVAIDREAGKARPVFRALVRRSG